MNNSFQYAAFLRGINVGGRALIKMADLRRAFEKLEFGNVRSFLASGNIIFEAEQKDKRILSKTIESELKKILGKDINVMLRSREELRRIQSSEPFKGIKITPSIRLYVTFLSEKAKLRTITIPYTLPEEGLRILHAAPREVFSVINLSKGNGTPDLMSLLEKEFGAGITTRNWNTVMNIPA